jgi:hypothetical protein
MNIGVIISMHASELWFQLTGRQSLCNSQNKGMKGCVRVWSVSDTELFCDFNKL